MLLAIQFICIIVASYFVGNVHFARLLSRTQKDDITKHGSGNPGTMNMLRTFGYLFGTVTLLLDGLKGALPALLAYLWLGGAGGGTVAVYAMYTAGLFAVLGHIFPLVYKFKGGKGVATAFGFFTVVNPLASLVCFAAGVLVLVVTKIGSLGSLFYISAFAIYMIATHFTATYILPHTIAVGIVVLIFWAHRSNLKKLTKKQESKVSFKEIAQKDKQMIQKNKNKNTPN